MSPPRYAPSLLCLEPDALPAAAPRPPVLIIGVGNPARGDDALGPLLLERLRTELLHQGPAAASAIELLDAYQLQPEHALDLRGRSRVIIADATTAGPAPFALSAVSPDPTPGFTTHSLSPAALAAVHQRLYGTAAPLWALAIRGARFGLGEGLSDAAAANLDAALAWIVAELDLAAKPTASA